MPHPFVTILLILVVSLAVVVPITWWVLTSDRGDRSGDNVSTAGIRFIGGVFVFIGSFSVITLWASQGQFNERLGRELGALVLLTDNITLASPASEGQAFGLLEEYVLAVRDDELAKMATGDRIDPLNGSSPRVLEALDGYSSLISDIEASAAQGSVPPAVSKLRTELTQLELDYLDRLSWQPPYAAVLLLPSGVIALATLLSIAFFPAGPRAWQKWLQSLLSAAVVVCILAMIVLLVSPQFQAASQQESITRYLTQIQEQIRG